MLQLAYKSGQVTDISAYEVHANDEFEYELGLTPKLRHKPAMKDRGEVILYYAVYHTKDGGYGFEVMSRDDVIAHMNKFSPSAKSSVSPWKSSFDSMAKKTVLRKLLKYAPLAVETARAMEADETIKTHIAVDMTELPDETVIEGEAEEIPTNVDPETGEIKDASPMSEDDRILEESLNVSQ